MKKIYFDPCRVTKMTFYIIQNSIQKKEIIYFTKYVFISFTMKKHSNVLCQKKLLLLDIYLIL